VIATPHIGAQTREAQRKASIQIANKVIEVLEKSAS
jgi:phosphoglycerate dehydrogenase-like enzyme